MRTTPRQASVDVPPVSLVESKSVWVAPSSKLSIPVPVHDGVRFLSLEFQVLSGSCIDFDVMLENAEDETAVRLYGPSRRAASVRTVLPLPHSGIAHATFDNFSSWVSSVQLKYTMRLSRDEPPEGQNTFSRLRFGDLVGRDGQLAQAEAREEEEEEEVARLALQDARPCEMKLAAGAHEEVELRVERPNTNLYVSVDMVKGRDVDFGIVLLSDDSDGQTPINLFGPCRRATNLSANVLVPSAGTVVVRPCLPPCDLVCPFFSHAVLLLPCMCPPQLGFDNSGMWFTRKVVRFRARLGDQSVSGVTDL